MKKGDELSLIDLGGSSEFNIEEVKKAGNSIKVIAGLFFQKVAEKARAKGLINTGAMLSNDNFKSRNSSIHCTTSLYNHK